MHPQILRKSHFPKNSRKQEEYKERGRRREKHFLYYDGFVLKNVV